MASVSTSEPAKFTFPYSNQTSKQISTVINIFISSKYWHVRWNVFERRRNLTVFFKTRVNDSQTDLFIISHLDQICEWRQPERDNIQQESTSYDTFNKQILYLHINATTCEQTILNSASNHRMRFTDGTERDVNGFMTFIWSDHLIDSEIIRIKGGFSVKPGNTLFNLVQTFSFHTIWPHDVTESLDYHLISFHTKPLTLSIQPKHLSTVDKLY